MAKRYLLLLAFVWIAVSPAPRSGGQQQGQSKEPVFRVDVDLVLLNVAVIDSKGHYVTNLRPSDFAVFEDGIAQKVSTFGEGNGPQRPVDEANDPARAGAAGGEAGTMSG